MSEETKKTAEAPEQEAKETEAAPQEAPETAAAPEKEAEAEPADAKKKDGWFNKKAREMDAVKAKLDAAEKNAAQAKDQLLRMAAEFSSCASSLSFFQSSSNGILDISALRSIRSRSGRLILPR